MFFIYRNSKLFIDEVGNFLKFDEIESKLELKIGTLFRNPESIF